MYDTRISKQNAQIKSQFNKKNPLVSENPIHHTIWIGEEIKATFLQLLVVQSPEKKI